jgi:hypothetical protein
MSGDDDVNSRRFGLQIELREIVQHVEEDACDFDCLRFRQLPRPDGFVDIAANASDRCKASEFIKDFGRTDVASVDDVRDAVQRSDGFGTKQAMRVGNDADDNRSTQLSVLSTQFSAPTPKIIACGERSSCAE